MSGVGPSPNGGTQWLRAERSQEANWDDFAHSSDELMVTGQHLPHLSLEASTESHRKSLSCLWLFCWVFFVLAETTSAWLIFVCGLRWPCWPLVLSCKCKEVGSAESPTIAFFEFCFAVLNPDHHDQYHLLDTRACAAAGPCL